MFQFLRKMIGPIMITVLVAFVATIIFSWGGGGFQSERPDDTVAIIDGENITFKDFNQFYTRLLQQERQKSDKDLTPQDREQIRNTAWRNLQADYLLNRELEKYNIFVSNQEIYDFLKLYPPQEIQASPQFMTDGQFDYQKYLGAMLNEDYAQYWASLEAYVLPDLKKYKLQEEIIGTVRITPAEVMQNYIDEKEIVKLAYMYTPYKEFFENAPEANDDEIRAFYDENREDYKREERAILDIVTFQKVPSDMDWERVKYEADELYDSAATGADFADIAMTFSEDNSAANGGDLGWFARGRMVAPFDSAAFAMNIGDISKPVKTNFGWHIIKLYDIRTGKDGKEERNAAHILLRVEPSSETLDQLSQNAEDFVNQAREKGFNEAAEEFNYDIVTTRKFSKNGTMQVLGQNKTANDFAFNSEVGSIADVINDRTGYHIIKLNDILPTEYVPFEEAKTSISTSVSRQKAKDIALDSVTSAYNAIINGQSLRQTARMFSFVYDTVSNFNRKGIIRNVGNDPRMIGAAFALKEVDAVTKPISLRNGVVVLQLLEKISPNVEEFNQAQDSIYQAALISKRQDMYNRWYNELVESADIETYFDKFYNVY